MNEEPKGFRVSLEIDNASAKTIERVSGNKETLQKVSLSEKSKNKLIILANRLLKLFNRR